MTNFVKLSELVGKDITIEKVHPAVWKQWDTVAGKMLMSHSYMQGYKKVYPIETNAGRLDVSAYNLKDMLEAVMEDGKSDINDVTFHVKSNGKQGIEIRYFFNPVYDNEDQEEIPFD